MFLGFRCRKITSVGILVAVCYQALYRPLELSQLISMQCRNDMVVLFVAIVKGDKMISRIYLANLSKQRRLVFCTILSLFSTAVHFPTFVSSFTAFLQLIDMSEIIHQRILTHDTEGKNLPA